jgi:hypothetical protein
MLGGSLLLSEVLIRPLPLDGPYTVGSVRLGIRHISLSGMGEHERRFREQAELGRWLAASEGYLVLARDGRQVGVVDHVRYEQHADHPDEIVIRRRNVFRGRRRSIPFSAVDAVDPRQRTVMLAIDSTRLERPASS